ncbi:translation initiation factor IF-3 [bacterium 3DAC]|nr:translation initiation factor IF-3 [Dictyoglomota bacterium]UZN23810.1 translation initiation factor IF-3 [bacterium 3DAC]
MRVNEQIRADKVRVVDENGKQIGVMVLEEAIRMARSRGYDLVEVAPNANPPVCKFINYDKYRYELAKKEKEARKKQVVMKIKEIRMTYNIDTHDLNVKKKKIREFLEDGDKVKVGIFIRGREMVHLDRAEEILNEIAEEMKDVGYVEKKPSMEGKRYTMVLHPVKQKDRGQRQKERARSRHRKERREEEGKEE